MKQYRKQGYFVTDNGENSKDLFIKDIQQKTVVRPKRALTAYVFFYIEAVERIRNENPEMTPTKMTQEIPHLWKELSEKDKQPYILLS